MDYVLPARRCGLDFLEPAAFTWGGGIEACDVFTQLGCDRNEEVPAADMTVKLTGAGYEPSISVTGPIDSTSVVACTCQGAQPPAFQATSGTTY